MDYFDVAPLEDLPIGKSNVFEVAGRLIGLFNCDGEILAIDDLCPHAGASLSAGYLEDEVITCPLHAWRFNVRDGTWCDNPLLKVQSYQVKVENERIFVGIPDAKDEEKPDSKSEA